MPDETQRSADADQDTPLREDGPIPSASDEKVLEETARLVREGRRDLQADPREPKPGQ